MNRVFNFSAGPATLPLPVLEEAQGEFLDFRGSGMSVMEMSHRGPEFMGIYKESVQLLREVASVPDNFDILYMTGGASQQFTLIPMNFSKPGNRAGYINTGTWSKKAIAQAGLQGVEAHICASSDDANFAYIPDKLDLPQGLDYVHMTSNNTIVGTQFAKFPALQGDAKLMIDMSSDFLSRPIDWTNIGMVYAGAQKNAGPSGLTIVIVDKAYYERESDKTPPLLRYSTYAENESMYNTPPTFPIYIFGLVLKWIRSQGGLEKMDALNREKAALIYDALDALPEHYLPHARQDSRSLMNITFNLKDKSREKEFLEGSVARKLSGLKGHRSVGGFRASIYNAMPRAGCEALAAYLGEFAGG